MKPFLLFVVLVLILGFAYPRIARADVAEIERLQARLVNGKRKVDLKERLKNEHRLSETQIAKFRSQGLDDKQIMIAARFAKASDKPIDAIVNMKLAPRTGWSDIAKKLGVDPADVGLKITRRVRYHYRPPRAETVASAQRPTSSP